MELESKFCPTLGYLVYPISQSLAKCALYLQTLENAWVNHCFIITLFCSLVNCDIQVKFVFGREKLAYWYPFNWESRAYFCVESLNFRLTSASSLLDTMELNSLGVRFANPLGWMNVNPLSLRYSISQNAVKDFPFTSNMYTPDFALGSSLFNSLQLYRYIFVYINC